MRTLFELLRIIVIFALLGGVGWMIIGNIYTINEATETYSWLGALAIVVLLFVLYRNKLQFSGWYKGKGRATLPKKVSLALIIISVLLIISPFIMGFLFS
ncbi:hypothetical protein [Virgibacillus alimentarius]|uniref:Membrane protein n=1 Tax=Virgibacillus alimentarius TaxID=698769 RepID=A0ABS4SAL1_9BACI|nr:MULTISPECIES: hypothetical protein [Virgibacillus]MBP2258548.1 putative membrane protein [Virgibacillus alimentarius]HLR67456.1 hypothetical protein [Virgibacillus sp.]